MEKRKGKGEVESRKIGIYKTPVRPIKQRPISIGMDRGKPHRISSPETRATTATPEDWTRGRFYVYMTAVKY